ncbi:MAG: copper chaperone PCu(A)C [Burkholderiales bacterium]|nr:copper chaperone PCu(A)C [Burkholderiales bacterium]
MNAFALKSIAHYARLAPFVAVFSPVWAHVSLQEPVAEPGSSYRAVLRVTHGCDGSPTTTVTVQLPAGLRDAKAEAREGWTLFAQGNEVRWTAATKEAALPSAQRGEFAINAKLPPAPGALWFKVQQTCEQGRLDWSQLPAAGTSIEGLKSPAVLLQVQALPAVKVEQAWVRSSVPGQRGSGGYMKLTARKAVRLVGISSPVAGVAEVHEMKMEGDVMKMRPLAGALELPAGKAVELRPGGLHLMLMDLKQPLAAGSSVALTLTLRDEKGADSQLEVKVPVAAAAPGGGASATEGHKH